MYAKLRYFALGVFIVLLLLKLLASLLLLFVELVLLLLVFFCQPCGYRCSKARDARPAECRWDEPRSLEVHCGWYSLAAARDCSLARDCFRRAEDSGHPHDRERRHGR